MAERRMFAKTIVDSDAFLDMPLSTQALYFHLSMRADDEGFINNPKKIQRMIGCGGDDLKLLVAKKFILTFDSGVIVIKHWKIHNLIRSDRFKTTLYQGEKEQIREKDNKSYTLDTIGIPNDNQMATNGIPNDNQMEPQVRLGKDRLGKDRLGKDKKEIEDSNHSVVVSISKIIDFWQKNGFGAINPKTVEDFQYWLADFEQLGASETDAINLVIKALEIAIENGATRYAYVNAILKNWESKRFVNADQVEAEEAKRQSRNKNGAKLENTGSSEYDDLF